MTSWNERNKGVIEEFRARGGRVKGWAPLMLLTTTGARTGQPRVAPLMLVTDGDRLLAVASKGGAPKHPDWFHNLQAHPQVTVEVGSEKFETTARILTGDERERAFQRAVEVFPPMVNIRRGRLAKFLSSRSNDQLNNHLLCNCIIDFLSVLETHLLAERRRGA